MTFVNAPWSPEQHYVPLPGRAGRAFSLAERQRLYMGTDHVMLTTRSFASERYNRFYLADIQSLTIQKTSAGAVLNMVLLSVAGLFATFAAAGYINEWDAGAVTMMTVVAAVFGGLAVLNTAFGPTCQCHVLTAVHEEPLYCLGRLWTAQRVIEYLRAMVEGVQGATGAIADTAAQRVERAADARETAAAVRRESGRLHTALFAALIVYALLGAVFMYYGETVSPEVPLMCGVAVTGLAIVAVVRQRGSDVPERVRTPVWIAFGSNMFLLAASMYVSVFIQAFRQTPDMEVPESFEIAYMTIANAVNLVVNSATGLFGLYAVRVWRNAAAIEAEQRRVADEEGGQP